MLNAQLVLLAKYAEFFRRNFCFAMFRIVEKKKRNYKSLLIIYCLHFKDPRKVEILGATGSGVIAKF